MIFLIKKFIKHKQAATTIEYVFLASIIGVGLVGTTAILGGNLGKKLTCIADRVQGLNACSGDTVFAGNFSQINSNNWWSLGVDTYGVGQTIDGWNIVSGTVDMVDGTKSYGMSKGDGSQEKFIDLDGLSVGTISRSIPTIPGREYTITFDHSANMDNPYTKKLQVSAGGTSQEFTKTNNHWSKEAFTFRATDSQTQISFASQNQQGCCWGSLLKNINVTLN